MLVAAKSPTKRPDVPVILAPRIPFVTSRLPAKVDEPVPLDVMLPVLMTKLVPVIPPAVRDLDMLREPAKVLEAVADRDRKRLADTSVEECRPNDVFSEPEKELEPVPLDVIWPLVRRLAAVRDLAVVMLFVTSKLPANVDEPTPESVRFPFNTMLPPMEALLVNSNPLNWVEAALKFQKPVIDCVALLEAGPLVQSSLTVETEAAYPTSNILASKLIDPVWW